MNGQGEQGLIPYPRGLGRLLLRLPILLYRMGLGALMSRAHIMILGTRGRKTGLPRYTAIEFRRHGSEMYVISAWGGRPQWFQNLKATPNILVQEGRRVYAARAHLVGNAGEALRVLHLFRRRAPWVYDPLIARMSARERISERTLPEISHEITIVRIDPTPEAPSVRPLPSDLGWVVPLAVVLGAITLILALARSRQE
jgi:deazaflavin-dependent oxidoreductase (nitroreductase family)